MMTNGQTAGDGTQREPAPGEVIRIDENAWMAGSKTRENHAHAITRAANGLIICSCEAGQHGKACWHKMKVLREITAEIAGARGLTKNGRSYEAPPMVVDPIDPDPFADSATTATKKTTTTSEERGEQPPMSEVRGARNEPEPRPTWEQLAKAHEEAAASIGELIDAEEAAEEAATLAAKRETERNLARARATSYEKKVVQLMKAMAGR